MRARVLVKEITIRKRGEIQFFPIRLPKNAVRIIGVDTDVLMTSVLEPTTTADGTVRPDKPGDTPATAEVNLHPFLQWSIKTNPTIGKLKLQSLDRHSIFFESWISLVLLNASMPDMRYGLFPKNPYSLISNCNPKRISVPVANPTINGYFTDTIGIRKQSDLTYTVKIFLWIETSEKDKGVKYDFENKNNKLN